MSAWYETPELLASGTDQHDILLNTRLELGNALGTQSTGTKASNYASGLHQYFSNKGLAESYSASFETSGLGQQSFNADSQLSVFANLVAAFARGPVVFHDAFFTQGTYNDSHAVTCVALELNDRKNNMRIDRGEAYAVIIDPLNPTKTYSPNAIDRAGKTDSEAIDLWNNSIQAGPQAQPFLQKVAIYQDFDRAEFPGALTFDYDQTAIIPSTTIGQSNNQLQFNADDTWFTKEFPGTKEGSIYGFIGLQRSVLPDNLIDSIKPTDRETVIFNFTDFIVDNQVSVKLFSYFNESSDYSNDLSFYQLADAQGSVLDPISGSRLSPGDAGYHEAALKQAQIFEASDSDGSNDNLDGRISQDAAQMGSFSFNLKAIDGTVLVAPIVTTSQGEVWTAFAEANRDGENHFRWNGGLSFQMEDQVALGDGDFNDLAGLFSPLQINGLA